MPVDTADILPPPDHLTDESLRRLDRHQALPPGALGAGHDIARIEELEIHRRGEARMVEPRLAGPDRILIAAKRGEPVDEEIVERLTGRFGCHRPVERLEAPRMVGEARVYQLDHGPGDRVGGEATRRGELPRPRLRKGAAVVGVEVPRPAGRLAILHQDAMLLPQRPVEPFQAELLPAARMEGKLVDGAEEVPVGANLEGNARLARRGDDLLPHPVLPRLDNDQLRRPPRRERRACAFGTRPTAADGIRTAEACHQRASQRTRLVDGKRGRERPVVDRQPLGDEPIAEVTHRGEEHHDPRLRRPDMRRLPRHLCHPDGILGGIESVKGRRAAVELVAENEDEVAGHRKLSGE